MLCILYISDIDSSAYLQCNLAELDQRLLLEKWPPLILFLLSLGTGELQPSTIIENPKKIMYSEKLISVKL